MLLPLLGANGLANIEACYLGGKSYVPGGTVRVSGNFIYTGTMFIYDTVADSWTLSVNYPGLGSSHPAVVCDPASNKVYAIGGLRHWWDEPDPHLRRSGQHVADRRRSHAHHPLWRGWWAAQ